MTPFVGQIVLYTLTSDDARHIFRRRESLEAWGTPNTGAAVWEGHELPMIITKSYPGDPADPVCGQVFLEGDDQFRAQHRCRGEGPGFWRPIPENEGIQ